ncbi:MAG: hypothetical protein F6K47_03310 [Symploca sp. SIO2E6]|nr:hypothetical protein [Symploca sp. SIO2E6]
MLFVVWELGIGNWELGIGNWEYLPYLLVLLVSLSPCLLVSLSSLSLYSHPPVPSQSSSDRLEVADRKYNHGNSRLFLSNGN